MDNVSERAFLATTLLVLTVLSLWLFSRVIWTIFFAITIAYVLHPLTKKLRNQGLSPTVSSLISTMVAVLAIFTIATPFLLVLYRRREILIDFLRDIPETFALEFLGFEATIELTTIINLVRDSVTDTALNLAQSTPSLLLKLVLLIVLVFAILRKPESIENAIKGMMPPKYEKVINDYHETTKRTIKGLYIVQLSTAVLTFLIGMPVFYLLGYEPFISLALLSGLLQFIPVIGPSLLILILAIFEILLGDITLGIIILAVGLVMVAALPDLILRPQLADKTTGMPASLYFLGFIGGILSLGAIGIIVGPLLIALFLETIKITSRYEEGSRIQQ